MPIGTPFHPRTSALCESMSWRDWAGYFAVSAYEASHEREYNAIRNAAALIDVSPLFKYRVSGKDATRLVDRVVTRDVPKMAVGQVAYTNWCDGDGKVIDDGTVSRLGPDLYRWTAAEPNLRWIRQNAHGLEVLVEDVSDRLAALALQGPTSRDILGRCVEGDVAGLKYFRVMTGAAARHPGRDLAHRLHRRPRLRDLGAGGSGAARVGRAHGGRPGLRHHADRHAGARRGAHRGGPHPARRGLHEREAGAHPLAEVLALRDRPRPAGEPEEGAVRGAGGAAARGAGRCPARARRPRRELGRRGAPLRGGRPRAAAAGDGLARVGPRLPRRRSRWAAPRAPPGRPRSRS